MIIKKNEALSKMGGGMKADKISLVLVILAFVALGLAYVLLTQHDEAAVQTIESLRLKVDGFDVLLKKIETQVKTSAESVKNIESKIAFGDVGQKDMTSKLESINKDLEQLREEMKSVLAAKEVSVSAVPAAEVSVLPPAGSASALAEDVAGPQHAAEEQVIATPVVSAP